MNINAASFFDAIRAHPFGGSLSQSQVDGINDLLGATNSLSAPEIAYVLGTAYWETAHTMQPIREIGDGKGHPYGAVDQTGKAPYGRGYVQLTWRQNYLKADSELGLGGKLAADYDLALDPIIAAKIIVRGMMEGWFTGKKLSDYLGKTNDFVNARRIINGTDHANDIASIAGNFLTALSS